MKVPLEKPGTPQELVHVGVKGMRWGVRNEEELVGINRRSKEYIKAIPKKSKRSAEEKQKNLEENFKKFDDKFKSHLDDVPGRKSVNLKRETWHKNQAAELQKQIDKIKENPSKWKAIQVSDNITVANLRKQRDQHLKDAKDIQAGHLTDFQKKALISAGVVTLAVGGLYAYGKFGPKPEDYVGKHVSSDLFEKFAAKSVSKTWVGDGYIQPSSFNRSGFTLPAGHTFYRLSHDAEKSFGEITYATHSLVDRDRYLSGAPGVSVKNLITFKSTKPVKIPHLTTVLDSLKEVMETSPHEAKILDTDVINEYNMLSGGRWNTDRGHALIRNLASKGYGGIVDEMDAGVFGDSPLVLFGDNFTSKVITPLTGSGIRERAMENIVELSSRKL